MGELLAASIWAGGGKAKSGPSGSGAGRCETDERGAGGARPEDPGVSVPVKRRVESRGRPQRLRRTSCPGRPQTPSAPRRTKRSSQPHRRTRRRAGSHRLGSPTRAGPRGRGRHRCRSFLSGVSSQTGCSQKIHSGRSRTRTWDLNLAAWGEQAPPMGPPHTQTGCSQKIHSGRSRTRTWDLFLIREAL